MNINHHLDAIEQGIDEVVRDVGADNHRPGSSRQHAQHSNEQQRRSLELEQPKPQESPESIASLAATTEIVAPVEVAEPSAFGASVLGELGSLPQPEAASEALHLAIALLDRYLPEEGNSETPAGYESAGVIHDTGTVNPSTEN